MKRKVNYLSNKRILQVLESSHEAGKCTDELAEIFILLANKLSTSYRFCGYSYKDIMISEAVYTMLKYWDKFDAEKSNNPFSYFTMISWNSFLVIMRKERKQVDIRDKIYNVHGMTGSRRSQE